MLANLRKRTRLIMFIVAVGFIGGFLLGGTLCEVVRRRGTRPREAEQGIVGRVGDHRITLDEYRGAVAYITDKYKQENQLRDLSNDDYAQIETQAWDFLVSELTWSKLLERARVRTSEEEIIEIMKANPPQDLRNNKELYNEQGEFDREKYLAVMNNPQNQPYFARYFRDLAEMLPKEKLRIDVVNSYRLTGVEIGRTLRESNSQWTIASLYFGPRLLTERAEPTDAELKAYYKSHPGEFKAPQVRQLRYVRFPLEIGPEDSAEAEGQIRKAHDQLQRGESFNMTMLDYSNLVAETISGYVARSRLDARTDSVVKGLKSGQYSQPYLADYGWQIVMLDSARADSIALRRILVRVTLGTDAAGAARDQVRQFIEQAQHEPFDSVAARNDLRVMRARPIVDRKPNLAGLDISSPSQLVDWALGAKTGEVSPEPIRGQSGFYVFEMSEIKPAGRQPFEEAAEAIKWKVRQAKEKEVWKARADQALAEIRQGRMLEQLVEADSNIELTTEQFLGVLDARRRKGAEFAGAVLALEPGQTSGVVETNWGAFILRCDSRQDVGTTAAEQYREQRLQQVSQEQLEGLLKQPEIKDYRDPFSY